MADVIRRMILCITTWDNTQDRPVNSKNTEMCYIQHRAAYNHLGCTQDNDLTNPDPLILTSYCCTQDNDLTNPDPLILTSYCCTQDNDLTNPDPIILTSYCCT